MLNDVKRGKIKKHFQDHKKKYVIAGAIIGVTAGVGFIGIKTGFITINETTVNRQTYRVTLPGRSGKVLMDQTSGVFYGSQKKAAEALGVDPKRIAEHLAGKIPHVQGHILTLLVDLT